MTSRSPTTSAAICSPEHSTVKRHFRRPRSGQELGNPIPQGDVMRALLRAGHRWVSTGTAAPPSTYPTLRAGSLTTLDTLRFPAIPRVTDPRLVEPPLPPLPYLVPQVDNDGNDVAGIRVPEQAVPLATTTGWNFRAEHLGNPTTIVALAGSYIPFARTRAERQANGDPRPSIEERYQEQERLPGANPHRGAGAG